MILSSAFQYLLYAVLICYKLDGTNGNTSTTPLAPSSSTSGNTTLTTTIDTSQTNSTILSKDVKSMLPLILGSVFGGLAIIVLIACIVTYILVKRGYIKVFNHSRHRVKEVKQTRISDSSSTVDD